MRIFIWICDIDIWLFFQLSMIYMEYPHFFNYNLQHISGIPPVCISCIKKKHIVNLMREIRFYCGKLWWTLIMTLISWAFRRSKSISTFFLHPVYALVPDPSWSFMDAIWRDIGLSCQAAGCSCWLQLLQSSRQFTRRIILVWCTSREWGGGTPLKN